jgi:hypothetical protein
MILVLSRVLLKGFGVERIVIEEEIQPLSHWRSIKLAGENKALRLPIQMPFPSQSESMPLKCNAFVLRGYSNGRSYPMEKKPLVHKETSTCVGVKRTAPLLHEAG